MTVSSATSRLLDRRAIERDDPCRKLHANWRNGTGAVLALAPQGRATITTSNGQPVDARWQCRKAGDIELMLPDSRQVLRPGTSGTLTGHDAHGLPVDWSRMTAED